MLTLLGAPLYGASAVLKKIQDLFKLVGGPCYIALKCASW